MRGAPHSERRSVVQPSEPVDARASKPCVPFIAVRALTGSANPPATFLPWALHDGARRELRQPCHSVSSTVVLKSTVTRAGISPSAAPVFEGLPT